ncbi:MAG: SufE family protein [Anaerolineaceae bacterium]|nr:MAG: SufE family protein [Anaerolineaceae bacterium]
MDERLQETKSFLDEVQELFAFLDNRMDKLQTLSEYGDELAPMDDELRRQEYLVPGCASATYVILQVDDAERAHFITDSESLMSKGYLYILTRALDGCTVEQIAKDAEPIVMGFAQGAEVSRLGTTQSRANAFVNIYNFMRRQAIAYLAQLNQERE